VASDSFEKGHAMSQVGISHATFRAIVEMGSARNFKT
jgi:hypothetical protein